MAMNSLPLTAELDGTTSGPRSFSGPLGKRLSTCEQLPVTHFVKIISDLPNFNLKQFSTDQKYLWQITNAVSEGNCPDDLSKQNPGNLNHSIGVTYNGESTSPVLHRNGCTISKLAGSCSVHCEGIGSMHYGCSVSSVSPCAKMTQDICSIPSSFPVIYQLSTNLYIIIVDHVIQWNA